MKFSISKLDKSIQYYEDINLNIKNCLSDVEHNWYGDSIKLFSNKVQEEQIKIEKNIIELKDVISVYNYCIQEYSLIGKKIEYKFDEIDKLYNYLNDYIDILKQILILYNNIPAKYSYLIEEQKRYFKDSISIIIEIKEKISSLHEKINNIETVVNSKLSKINIEIIKESECKGLM